MNGAGQGGHRPQLSSVGAGLLPLLTDEDPLGVGGYATHHLPLPEARGRMTYSSASRTAGQGAAVAVTTAMRLVPEGRSQAMTDEKFPARTVVSVERDDLNERPESANAILVGGPGDQAQVSAADAAVVHLRMENLVHRYIRTERHRDVDGRSLLVYNYDGEERTEYPDIVHPTAV
jgi:hypothetical protein